jgi:hypothetical protein
MYVTDEQIEACERFWVTHLVSLDWEVAEAADFCHELLPVLTPCLPISSSMGPSLGLF